MFIEALVSVIHSTSKLTRNKFFQIKIQSQNSHAIGRENGHIFPGLDSVNELDRI